MGLMTLTEDDGWKLQHIFDSAFPGIWLDRLSPSYPRLWRSTVGIHLFAYSLLVILALINLFNDSIFSTTTYLNIVGVFALKKTSITSAADDFSRFDTCWKISGASLSMIFSISSKIRKMHFRKPSKQSNSALTVVLFFIEPEIRALSPKQHEDPYLQRDYQGRIREKKKWQEP